MHVGNKIPDEIRKLQISHESSKIADAALYLSKKNSRDRITSLEFEEKKP